MSVCDWAGRKEIYFPLVNFEAVVGLEGKAEAVVGDFLALPSSGLMPIILHESAMFISHFLHAMSDF